MGRHRPFVGGTRCRPAPFASSAMLFWYSLPRPCRGPARHRWWSCRQLSCCVFAWTESYHQHPLLRHRGLGWHATVGRAPPRWRDAQGEHFFSRARAGFALQRMWPILPSSFRGYPFHPPILPWVPNNPPTPHTSRVPMGSTHPWVIPGPTSSPVGDIPSPLFSRFSGVALAQEQFGSN